MTVEVPAIKQDATQIDSASDIPQWGKPDSSRIIAVPFLDLSEDRKRRIITDVLSFSDKKVEEELTRLDTRFADRHDDISAIIQKNFEKIRYLIPEGVVVSPEKKRYLGLAFTRECAIESAALFNPSIVLHPDQSNVKEGCKRVIISLRATSEGHVSAVEFRSGTVDKEGRLQVDEAKRPLTTGKITDTSVYSASQFKEKLVETGVNEDVAAHILGGLAKERFGYDALNDRVRKLDQCGYFSATDTDTVNKLNADKSLASNKNLFNKRLADERNMAFHWVKELENQGYVLPGYEISFPPKSDISSRVIFPKAEFEKKGIEDVRFVQFKGDNDEITYYGTATAFDGARITPQLISTKDFQTFTVGKLEGDLAQNKGMALFPRKIEFEDKKSGEKKSHYAMLGRQDGENITVMFSDDLLHWNRLPPVREGDKENIHTLETKREPWNLIQSGNCGSPIETKKGWLVITHGVSAMREYTIGAMLLDKDDPTKVIAETKKPLIESVGEQREGYVPNVVYSCGAIAHGDNLILPFAVSDKASSVHTFSIQDILLNKMEYFKKEEAPASPLKRFNKSREVPRQNSRG